jgi:4-carboxymuconolactone decarboxylase
MDDRYEAGLDAYASQFHIPREEVPAKVAELVGERFGEESIYSAARAWTDEGLSLRDRSLVVIAALIAQGGLEGQLRSHTRWAIEHGSSREELEELAAMLAIYAGFARASTALMIVRDELAKLEGDAG